MRARDTWIGAVGIAAASYGLSATAQSTQAITAGELVVEPPTLISLGFEWYVEGDADRDAAVAVAYRRVDEELAAVVGCRVGQEQSERNVAADAADQGVVDVGAVGMAGPVAQVLVEMV